MHQLPADRTPYYYNRPDVDFNADEGAPPPKSPIVDKPAAALHVEYQPAVILTDQDLNGYSLRILAMG